MKSQTVRLIDVFVLGPGMIYIGSMASDLPAWARAFLLVTGGATIWYNGKNYLDNRESTVKTFPYDTRRGFEVIEVLE